MTVSARDMCLVFSIGGIVGAIPSIIAACYYLFLLRSDIRPERRMFAYLVAPVAIFLPQFWNERGNTYRRRFLISLIAFGVFASMPLICDFIH